MLCEERSHSGFLFQLKQILETFHSQDGHPCTRKYFSHVKMQDDLYLSYFYLYTSLNKNKCISYFQLCVCIPIL